jgi:signal transduction histidine kinase
LGRASHVAFMVSDRRSRIHSDQDLSPSKRQERLISAERLKATVRVASEMAHELNTPLGGILMYSHLLLEDLPEDDANREKVLKINKLAHRCKMIIQGLRDFAYQESLHQKPVQINRILHNVIGFLEDHILLRDVSIETFFASHLPQVRGDENKLEQVFINLIINAAQSMDGAGTLTLRTEFAPGRNSVRIECSDTGCGIDDNNLGRVFEPFFTTKKKSKGTGLGLSICHGIVEQHGGTITLESSEGHGSTFTIFLPVAEGNIAHELEIADPGFKAADRRSKV